MGAHQSKIDEFSALTKISSRALMLRDIEKLCGVDQRDNSTHIEQLLKCLKSVCCDESKMVLFFEIGKLYINQDLTKAIDYIKKSLEVAVNIDNYQYRGQILWTLGEIEILIGRTEVAIKFFLKYLDIWEKIFKPMSKSNIFWSICVAYIMIADYDMALEYDKEYLEAFKSENAKICAVVSDPLFEYDTRFDKEESLTSTPCGSIGLTMDSTTRSSINVNWIKYSGVEMRYERRYSDAVLLFKWLLNISKKLNDTTLQEQALFYLQDTHRRLAKQYIGTAVFFDNFELIERADWSFRYYCILRVEIGTCSTWEDPKLLRYDIEGRYSDGLNVYTENLEKYRNDANQLYTKSAYEDLGNVSSNLGMYKESIGYYRQAYILSDGNSKTMCLASIAFNLFFMSYVLEEYKTAIECLQRYLELVKQANHILYQLRTYKLLIESCIEAREYDLAYNYIKEFRTTNFEFPELNERAKYIAKNYSKIMENIGYKSEKSTNGGIDEMMKTKNSNNIQFLLRRIKSSYEITILTHDVDLLCLRSAQKPTMESHEEKVRILQKEMETFEALLREYTEEQYEVSGMALISK